MARLTTVMATLAAMTAGPLTPAPAGAQTAVGRDSTPGSQWLTWNEATRTVTFELIAGTDGAAKSPFNFNGYTDGEANLIVPPGSTVVMNFVQKDGTPHSAELIADKDYTNKAVEGLPQEARDIIRFTAPESGSFRIFCGVPGHGLSGMWIRFTVDPAAKAPRFETKKAA
jgi:plastocyanin